MTRMSSRGGASRASETKRQSRYPSGICLTNVGFDSPDAGPTYAAKPASVTSANKDKDTRSLTRQSFRHSCFIERDNVGCQATQANGHRWAIRHCTKVSAQLRGA